MDWVDGVLLGLVVIAGLLVMIWTIPEGTNASTTTHHSDGRLGQGSGDRPGVETDSGGPGRFRLADRPVRWLRATVPALRAGWQTVRGLLCRPFAATIRSVTPPVKVANAATPAPRAVVVHSTTIIAFASIMVTMLAVGVVLSLAGHGTGEIVGFLLAILGVSSVLLPILDQISKSRTAQDEQTAELRTISEQTNGVLDARIRDAAREALYEALADLKGKSS